MRRGFIPELWTLLFGERSTKQTLTHPRDPLLAAWFGGGENTVSSMEINNNTAMTISAVYAAIRAISEDIAKLPLILYSRLDDGGKERAIGNPLFRLLHDSPNDEMGSFDFRETVTGWAMSWGNGYAQIERGAGGRARALHILPTPGVLPDRLRDGTLFYDVQTNEINRAFPAQDIFHIRGMSSDGIKGWNPIGLARESLGHTMAIDRYGATFFGNNAMPGGVLEHPAHLEKEDADRLRESWEDIHKKVSGSHKVAVLEEGMKWHQVGLPAEDAQMIEAGQFRVEDVARWFRIPLHKLQNLLRATFSNIEEQSLEYVQDTLTPWAVRWEQEIQRKLIPLGEQSTLFAEHLFAALLRGDMKSRSEALQIQRRSGIINADEWRAIENMNTLPNGEGQVYIVEKNMATLDQIQNPPDVPPVRLLVDRIAEAHIEPLAEAFGRVLRVESDKVTRAAKKDGFDEWCKTFYDEHVDHVRGAISVPIDAAARAIYASVHEGDLPEVVEQMVAVLTAEVSAIHILESRCLIDGKVVVDVSKQRKAVWEYRAKSIAETTIHQLTQLIQGLKNGDD